MDLLKADSINTSVEEKFGERSSNRVVLPTESPFISEQDYEVQAGQSLEKRVRKFHQIQAVSDNYMSSLPRPEKVYPLGLGRKLVQEKLPCGDSHEMACCAIYLAFTQFGADERYLFHATFSLGSHEHSVCMYVEQEELPDHDWPELGSICANAIIIDPWLDVSCEASQYGGKARDVLQIWERLNILVRGENDGEQCWVKPTRFYESLQASEVHYLRPDGRPARLPWA